MEHLQPKDPKQWYFNRWQETQDETAELQEKGLIHKWQVGDSESLMVDVHNEERLNRHIKNQIKEQKEADHW